MAGSSVMCMQNSCRKDKSCDCLFRGKLATTKRPCLAAEWPRVHYSHRNVASIPVTKKTGTPNLQRQK